MSSLQALNLSILVFRPLKLRFSLKTFWIFSFVSIIILLAFYIFQINSVTSEGYLLQNYQKKLNQLRQENKILEINLAQLNSLGSVEKQIERLGFEKVDKVFYIQVLENQIVTK
jgi:cell division protein FtsB